MLWIRGVLFTILVPCLVAGWVPHWLVEGKPLQGGLWQVGWLPLSAGAALYTWCLASFLLSGGTPAIFFTRPLRYILGEEPAHLVRSGLYKYSRNPMYLAVILAITGQALLYASLRIAEYALMVWAVFHLVVVALEEPHLRGKQGSGYEDYCRRVPRWLGPRHD